MAAEWRRSGNNPRHLWWKLKVYSNLQINGWLIQFAGMLWPAQVAWNVWASLWRALNFVANCKRSPLLTTTSGRKPTDCGAAEISFHRHHQRRSFCFPNQPSRSSAEPSATRPPIPVSAAASPGATSRRRLAKINILMIKLFPGTLSEPNFS